MRSVTNTITFRSCATCSFWRYTCSSRHIAAQISHAFGIDIDKDVVRRVLAQHYRSDGSGGRGPSWLTFIAQTKDSLWSVDLFRCESVLLHSYWVMVVMDAFTRRIVGFGIERADIDGVAVCRMFNRAVAGQPLPKHISTDHDPLFRFHRWLANLRILEIDEIKTVPHVSVSHPFVERLIGTVRREFLDHVFFWNALDLERKLQEFRGYYNSSRVHQSLAGVRRRNFWQTTAKVRQAGFLRVAEALPRMFQTPIAA